MNSSGSQDTGDRRRHRLSGAGVNGKDLAEYSCPEPLPVMVMHSRNDTVFPGYGAEAARWEVRPQECGYDRGPRAIACFVERPLKNSSRLKASFGVARPLITTIVRSRTAINARPLRSGRPFPAGTR
jgi:hypothetical protein